ncbi:hypothetical protein M409DRAFT_55868 [Zasmidium cellare ATCC 36951]|uniref:Extracellular membrane protein CFEM domain-containing protein n=1 Tax=Zasmidium cellare ATCC 36951 TaxID=1080233 RepID=A0A6A6CEI2_ZASCE|nr:uncharacterized protein M409DRAFT_55868 [Zasmidium cellare ATCC 36951]KAF2165481.1 hypothetical protein M409DRAFT_55868 [Zasmidium cellare ATCC 36951]
MKHIIVLLSLAVGTTFANSPQHFENDTLPTFPEKAIGPPRGGGGRGQGGRPQIKPQDQEVLPPGKDPEIWKPTPADAAEYDLGRAPANQDQLYWNFAEPADRSYFAKMFTFFVGVPGYEFLASENVYADQPDESQPFQQEQAPYQENALPTGQPLRFARTIVDTAGSRSAYFSRFAPRNPADLCGAWTSLVAFCQDGGISCGCYSGTYYVPDMWNSLAYGCARYKTDADLACDLNDPWCTWAETASEYTEYCTPGPDAVRFAATIDGSTAVGAQIPSVQTSDVEPVNSPAPSPASPIDTGSASMTSPDSTSDAPTSTDVPTSTQPTPATEVSSAPPTNSPTSAAFSLFQPQWASAWPWIGLIAASHWFSLS